MAAYKLAIEQGEISTQQFIQASLILAEAYHEIDTKKSSPHFGVRSSTTTKSKKFWLEASIELVEKTNSLSKAKYDKFNKSETLKLSKAFGYDYVSAMEYKAWAYTVKLKLNGCLEHFNQNPVEIKRSAIKFKNRLENN